MRPNCCCVYKNKLNSSSVSKIFGRKQTNKFNQNFLLRFASTLFWRGGDGEEEGEGEGVAFLKKKSQMQIPKELFF